MPQSLIDQLHRRREVTLLGVHVGQVQVERPVGRGQGNSALERRHSLFRIAQLAPRTRSYDFRQHDPFNAVHLVAQGKRRVSQVYVCGPPAMSTAVLSALRLADPARQVRAERFGLV